MALNITYQPEDIMFLRNRQRIYGSTDLPLYEGGQKALIQFFFFNQGFEDGGQFSITNDDQELVVEYFAATTPVGPSQFQAWDGGLFTLQSYIDGVFLPLLQGIPFIANNYNVSTSTLGTARYVTIEAKKVGATYTLGHEVANTAYVLAESSFPFTLIYTEGEDQTYNGNLYISCDIYKRTFLSDNQEDWTLLDRLREFPDMDGVFEFDVADTCLKALEPSVSVTGLPEGYDMQDRQPARFRFVVYENDPDLESNPTAIIMLAAGIYGGLMEPVNTGRSTGPFFDGATPRKLLTNAPRTLVVPPDFAFCLTAWHVLAAPQATDPRINIQPYDRDGNELAATANGCHYISAPVFSGLSQDALTIWEFIKKREEEHYLLTSFPARYELWFSQVDGDGDEDNSVSEKITLLIDPHRHHQVNYFIFQNAMGATEVCWTYGDLRGAMQPEGEDYVRNHHTSQSMFQQWPGSGAQRYSDITDIFTSFTVRTGLKPVNEIQWMLEMIGSPLVYWMTREGLRKWRADDEISPIQRKDRTYLQPIIIKKESVDFFDSENGRTNMEFSFTLAHSSIVPPPLIINR